MSKTISYELPDEIYHALEALATRAGRPVEDVALEWMAKHAPRRSRQLTPEEEQAARDRLRQYAGAADSGDPHSGDNERIDEDLAREYMDTHENTD